MSKEKIYGLIILLFGLIGMIEFTILTLVQRVVKAFKLTEVENLLRPLFIMSAADAVMLSVWVATMMVLFIIFWIGFTMFTTPPPEPIDFDELELEDEEESSSEEETEKKE